MVQLKTHESEKNALGAGDSEKNALGADDNLANRFQ